MPSGVSFGNGLGATWQFSPAKVDERRHSTTQASLAKLPRRPVRLTWLKTQLAAGVWDGKLAASTSLAGPSRPIRRFGANDNPEEATVKLAYLWLATVLGISLLGAAVNGGESPRKLPRSSS